MSFPNDFERSHLDQDHPDNPFTKAYRNVQQRIAEKVITHMVLYETDEIVPPEHTQFLRYLDKYKEVFVHKKPLGFMITLNPPSDYDHVKFYDDFNRILNFKWVQNCGYVTETTDNEDRAPHVHLFVDNTHDKSKSDIKSQLWKVFSKHLPDENKLHIKPVYTKEHFDRSILYLSKQGLPSYYGTFVQKFKMLKNKNKKNNLIESQDGSQA